MLASTASRPQCSGPLYSEEKDRGHGVVLVQGGNELVRVQLGGGEVARACHLRRGQKCVDDGLFGRLDRRGENGVHVDVVDVDDTLIATSENIGRESG